jgi:hypothetical protein
MRECDNLIVLEKKVSYQLSRPLDFSDVHFFREKKEVFFENNRF